MIFTPVFLSVKRNIFYKLRIIFLVLIIFTAHELFAEENLYMLLEDWIAVENALNKNNDTDIIKLLDALEKFRVSFDSFTSSLLFSQYEKMGLFQKENAQAIRRQTSNLLDVIKQEYLTSHSPDARTEDLQTFDLITALDVLDTDAIRQEIISWIRLDAEVSSNVFSRFINIFGIFLLSFLVLTGVVWFLYRTLRLSQIHERESAEFTRITMMAQEKERALISADLHDTVLQDMGRLLQLNEEISDTAADYTRQIINRIREICRTLMPPDFSRLALTDSLIQLCRDFETRSENRSKAECRPIIAEDFSKTIESGLLSARMQLQVYRIVQEALTNIEKHGQASEATLTARIIRSSSRNKNEKTILICVTDDGIGISESEINSIQQKQNLKLGIRGMYQRASILNANLSFIPGAGKGLTMRLTIPLDQ